MMFLRLQTQWSVTMGGYVGLKYEVLLGAGGLMSLYDVDNPRELLEEIQVMEAAALSELNKKNGK
tara:strand:+ start:971 stop:1165 length:195 start_codon:yes stop_codon:yes gene_type:complete